MSRTESFVDQAESSKELLVAARDTCLNAYAPYSAFAVGAAVRTRSGSIYTGANLENAAYGLGMCAEVAAITAANSAGDYNLEAIAVVGLKFSEPSDASLVVTPCGRCRQLLAEASQMSGTDVQVFSCSGDLSQIHLSTISELLPDAFGPRNLGLANRWPEMRGMLVRQVRRLQQTPASDDKNQSLRREQLLRRK